MNLKLITKNHEPDSKIGFLTKTISKPFSRARAMPLAWELSALLVKVRKDQIFNKRSFSSSWTIRRNFLFFIFTRNVFEPGNDLGLEVAQNFCGLKLFL